MDSSAATLPALGHLLKASSKAALDRCINVAFASRSEPPTVCSQLFEQTLSISAEEATQTVLALRSVILNCLYSSDVNVLDEMLNDAQVAIDARLVNLLKQTIASRLPEWRDSAVFSRVSLPTLLDVDWRLDVKKSSNELARMNVPTVLVGLEVRDQPQNIHEMPAVRHVNFELSKETLDTMLDGLGRIRDQLNKVSGDGS